MKTLRFHIDGAWSAQDFADYFASVNYVYSVLAVVNIERDSAREWEHHLEEFDFMFHKMLSSSKMFRHWLAFQRSVTPGPLHLLDATNLDRSFTVIEDSERLKVRRLQFASPGHTDLSGIGQAMGHVKDIVSKLIDIRVNSKERKLNNEILEEECRSAALRNLREQISILKELGYTEAEVRAIVASSNPSLEKLSQFANCGMLTAITETNDQESG